MDKAKIEREAQRSDDAKAKITVEGILEGINEAEKKLEKSRLATVLSAVEFGYVYAETGNSLEAALAFVRSTYERNAAKAK